MKKIPLTRGMFAIVDNKDYKHLAKFKWHALSSRNKRFYASRASTSRGGKQSRAIMMHREILGLSPHDPRKVDHRKPLKTLDNRRKNLRICTPSQNRMNTPKRSDNHSGFKGVWRGPIQRRKKWRAGLCIAGKHIFLGCYGTAREAHAAYSKAAKKIFGEFARTG